MADNSLKFKKDLKIQNIYDFLREKINRISTTPGFVSDNDLKKALINPAFNLQEKIYIMRLLEYYNDISGVNSNLQHAPNEIQVRSGQKPNYNIRLEDLRYLATRARQNPGDSLVKKIQEQPIHTIQHIKLIGDSHKFSAHPNTQEWGDVINPATHLPDKLLGKKDGFHQFKMQWITGYANVIRAAANAHNIPPLLLAGAAYAEVGGDPTRQDDVMRFYRQITPSPGFRFPFDGNPNLTSFGNVSTQISVAAEVLGYDFEKMTENQSIAVINSLKDPNENLYIAAAYLANLKEKDFSGKPFSDFTDQELQLVLTRFNRGGSASKDEIKKHSAYGLPVVEIKKQLLEALRGNLLLKKMLDFANSVALKPGSQKGFAGNNEAISNASKEDVYFEEEEVVVNSNKKKSMGGEIVLIKDNTLKLNKKNEKTKSNDEIIKEAKETAKLIGTAIEGVGQLVESFLSGFSGIDERVKKFIVDAAKTVSGVIGKAASGDWVGAALQAGTAYWQAMGEMIGETFQYWDLEKNINEATKEIKSRTLELEYSLAAERLRIRKQNGEDILNEEVQLIGEMGNLEKERINDKFDDQEKNVHNSGIAGFFRSLIGVYNPVEQARLNSLKRERQVSLDIVDQQTKQKQDDAKKSAYEKKMSDEKESENRATNAKLVAAKLAGDKLAEADAQAEQDRLDVWHKYEPLFREATERGITDQSQLTERYLNEKELADKNSAHRKLEIQADQKKAEQSAEYDHQEHLLNMKEDGFEKELALMELQRNRKLGDLDADREVYKGAHDEYQRLIIERSKHAEGSDEWNKYNNMLKPYEAYNKEYVRLTQARNNLVEASDKERAEAEAENEKQRKDQLANYRNQIGMLQAQLTDSAQDDVLAGARISSYELNQEQAEAEKQARQKYGHDQQKLQEVLTEMSTYYELKRANQRKQSEKQLVEAMKQDRESQYKADIKHLEQAIKLEQERLKDIEKQNKAIQVGIDKKEKERKQALKKFDDNDRSVFANLVQGVDYDSALQQGLADIHNPDGVQTETYSTESIQDALKERISLMELENENQYKLEQIGKSSYLSRKQDIAALQARSAEESLKDVNLSSRQRLELEQMKADAYVNFQDAYRQGIDNTFDEQIANMQALIDVNNDSAAIIQANIDQHQEGIDKLTIVYEKDLEIIDKSTAALIDKNAQWAVSLENIKQPLQEVAEIFETLNKASQGVNFSGVNPQTSSNIRGQALESAASRSRTKSAPGAGIYTIDGGDGWYYKSTTDMLAHQSQKMATGGVVPGGYPNDTYPALLTSGEAVLPAWFTNLLASAYQTMPGLSGLVDNSRKVQITLQGIFNEPGVVKREIMQALQQANYSAAGVNGTYYMNTGLN